MSREGGFDRERILEWLQSVDLQQPSSESDRGSTFDPDSAPQASTRPAAPLSQLQQQDPRHYTQQKRHTSPLLLGQRRLPTPTISLPRLPVSARAQSLGSLPGVDHSSGSGANVTSSQTRGHLLSLHSRKKSDSPLPEIASTPELPIFIPQTPIPPGSRTQTKSRQIPVPIPGQSGLGAAKLSHPTLPPTVSSSQQAEGDAPVIETMTSVSTTVLGEGSDLYLQTSQEEVIGKMNPLQGDGSDDRATSHGADVASDVAQVPASPLQVSEHTLSTASSDKVAFTLAPITSDAEYGETASLEKHEGEREGEREERERERESKVEEEEEEGEGGEDREMCAPLSDIELALLSLQVVDILPQLAVCLCMEYSEYERITHNEPSPQRQSMAVLMTWFRSSGDCGRRDLAHALERFGDKYSSLAQQLLRGQLEEFTHPSLLKRFSQWSEKPDPSPSSPTPAPLSHRHPSPLPLPLTTHLSPEHKPRTISPSSLTTQRKKLKQGFTFDEDRRSSDILPKFLSSRSMWTLQSTESPQSLLPSGPHPVQRRLSDTTSHSAGYLSIAPGPTHYREYTRGGPSYIQRKSSLQPHQMIQSSGGEGESRRHHPGSHHYGSETSLQTPEPSGVLLEREHAHYTPEEGLEKQGTMTASVDTERTRLGALQLADSPHGSLTPLRPHQQQQQHLPPALLGRTPKLSPAVGLARSHKSHGRGARRRMNRQDSGIETLASNSSALP